jgi:hypothetical protein
VAPSLIQFLKRKKCNTGWRVKASLSIGLHKRDQAFLELIESILGVGSIYKHGKDSVQLRVQ